MGAEYNDKVVEFVRSSQSLTVTGDMATVVDGVNQIHATAYLDVNYNTTDDNSSVIQNNGSSNRIAWANVNGVTVPSELRALNIRNTGPQYVTSSPDDVVVIEDLIEAYSDAGGIQFVSDRPSFMETGASVDPSLFMMVPYVPSLVPFDCLNRACVLSDMLQIGRAHV